jgi:hypothetical protein
VGFPRYFGLEADGNSAGSMALPMRTNNIRKKYFSGFFALTMLTPSDFKLMETRYTNEKNRVCKMDLNSDLDSCYANTIGLRAKWDMAC